jgi:hypothetical protein
LEGFDPIGGERSLYRSLGEGKRIGKYTYTAGPAVESSGEMTDGRSFADFREFRACLLDDREQVASAIAGKLLVYGTGRPLTALDRSAVEAVLEAARKEDFGFRSMIHAVVDSELFSRR